MLQCLCPGFQQTVRGAGLDEQLLGCNVSAVENNNEHDEDIISILDPDILLLKPLLHVFDLDNNK